MRHEGGSEWTKALWVSERERKDEIGSKISWLHRGQKYMRSEKNNKSTKKRKTENDAIYALSGEYDA